MPVSQVISKELLYRGSFRYGVRTHLPRRLHDTPTHLSLVSFDSQVTMRWPSVS